MNMGTYPINPEQSASGLEGLTGTVIAGPDSRGHD